MSRTFVFNSALAPYIRRLVEEKESTGSEALRTKWILKEIDDFATSYGLEEPVITKELIDAWRKTRINDCDSTLYTKYSIWSQLGKLMCRCGISCYILRLPKQPESKFVPYIYTHEQITKLFDACDNVVAFDRHYNTAAIMMPALLRLLYSTGLRISEALSLENRDIHHNERYIHVRKSKNGCERILPICDSLDNVLLQYESYRSRLPVGGLASPRHIYFVKLDGTSPAPGTICSRFHSLLRKCGIPYEGNHHGPRVHDLRHTMAVHSLAQMVENGMDIYTGLPLLSACLGHKSLKATEQYVRLTFEYMPELQRLCSPLNAFVYPHIVKP